jgi:adenosylcobinamide kinase/adenosylcobinamide-phosphate guanylyltransferase
MSPAATSFAGASIRLLLGGVRAGKSGRAVALAEAQADATLFFVATAQAFDDEMRQRIANHRAERSARWRTIEAPVSIVPEIDAALSAPHLARRIVVVDCLTLWVSNLLLALPDHAQRAAEQHVAREVEALVACMQRHADVQWILVSNEVGLGIVPPTPLGRVYRDALGRTNQIVAAAADIVELMVAGIVMPLKPPAART